MSTKSDKNKELLLEQFKKTPIVESACQKLGIGRSTYYSWREGDSDFAKKADEALMGGKFLVNDLAESQLIAAVKDRNLNAITYWLRHHHPDYTNTLQLKHTIEDENLTPEQEELVRKALRLATAHNPNIINVENHDESEINPTTGISGDNDQGQESPNSDN